jgi:hypothetical protein
MPSSTSPHPSWWQCFNLFFFLSLTRRPNKVERLSLASLSDLAGKASSLPQSGTFQVLHSRVGPWPYPQILDWLERLAGTKNSSLLRKPVNYGCKSFIRFAQVSMLLNFLSLMPWVNKLDCLYLGKSYRLL